MILNFVTLLAPGIRELRHILNGEYSDALIATAEDLALLTPAAPVGAASRFTRKLKLLRNIELAAAGLKFGQAIYFADSKGGKSSHYFNEGILRLLGVGVLSYMSRINALALSSRVVLNAPGGTQTAPARFVRRVQPGETITDLIAEGRAATWVNEAEHAIISLERTGPGRLQRVVVSGGRDGIEFIERGGNLFFEMEGQLVQVGRVIGHTHPRVTGPSPGDLNALRMLGQTRSSIIEIGGEPGGTLIRPR
jgi:hypothetical protein